MTRAESSRAPHAALWTLALIALLAIRLPSLVEPAGGDQSLYAYVGQRINAGGVPYRDAWDQKPPAIHFLYSALWRTWPHESVVAAADIAAAALTAWLLVAIGRRTFGGGVGAIAAGVFLLLGNPAIQRLGGVRVRSQCETFIALAAAAALLLVIEHRGRFGRLLLAGVFSALAFWLKYNAGIYLLPVAAVAVWGTPGLKARGSSVEARGSSVEARGPGVEARGPGVEARGSSKPLFPLALGFVAISAAFLAYFAAHGALADLRLATLTYNLEYSAETYEGFEHVLDYLTFPVERARLDLLWYLGGIGAIVLLATRPRDRATWMVAGWIAAACVAIAVNGARDLPQYFVQACPPLAIAAAFGLRELARRDARPVVRFLLLAALLAGLWRVGNEPVPVRFGGLPEIARNAAFDIAYARGRLDRATFLARFQQQADAKYVPLAAERLTAHVRQTTDPSDRILVFGFAASVYVNAPRQSASRFFWSRPVVVEFARDIPGYGSRGLLQDLERSTPAVIALQKHWGDPSPLDFFMGTLPLRAWLEARYSLDHESPDFVVWRRRAS